MYLLTSSCHPAHVTDNIPFSLALRIIRICSKVEDRDLRLNELKQLLLDRDYKVKVIDAAIEKAKNIPRKEALKRVTRTTTDRPVFPVTHHPALPSIPKIINKNYRTMTQNPHMQETFPKPPMVAYKRPKNIRDFIIKAKVAKKVSRPKRVLPGMHKCNIHTCKICPYIHEGKKFTSHFSHKSVEATQHHSCKELNCIYLIQCKKCNQQYIGETKSFYKRMLQHLSDARNKRLHKAIGEHFSGGGHKMSDMTFTVIERLKNFDFRYRKARESYHIEQWNLKYKGLNKKK